MVLLGTLPILGACNNFSNLDTVTTLDDKIIGIDSRTGSCLAIGKKRYYVVSGKISKMIPKIVNIPAGVCFDAYPIIFHKFNINELIDNNIEEFPELKDFRKIKHVSI